MKPSHTDQPRRRPVAFRWKRSSVPEFVLVFVAISLSSPLPACQYEALYLLLAVQVDHRPEELPLLVRAAGIDRERAPDPGVTASLVDVAVKREGRLPLLDRLLDGGRAHRDYGPSPVLGAQVLGELRGVVEARPVGRAVEIVDGLLRRRGDLRGHLVEALLEVFLGLFAVGVPRRAVRPPRRDHLVAAELDDPSLGELDVVGRGDDLVDLELVVVAGAHEALDAGALELLVGHLHPALDGAEHLLVEELLAQLLVLPELGYLVRGGAERVVAAPPDRLLELLDLVLAAEVVAVLQELRLPAALALLDNRDERFARHVAAEDQDVRLVVLAGVQELLPADLRTVYVGSEEDPRLRFSGKELG